VLKQHRIDSVVVPAGCTRYIQAADVSWIKSFKCKLQQFYDKYMLANQIPTTAGGNLKAPPLELICHWCVDAWQSIPASQIVGSFKLCGLTNALDGSEDHLILAFKEGQACAAGCELLQQAQRALASGTLEAEEPEMGVEEHAVDESDDDDEILAE